MSAKKILAIMVILLMNSQFAFANYAFYKKVSSTCKYYRVTVDQKKMALTKNVDGSYQFSIEMQSLRNNFEMVMLVGFISVGQAINHQESFAKKKPGYTAIVPGNTEVTVTITFSRQNTIITAQASAEHVRKLTYRKFETAG